MKLEELLSKKEIFELLGLKLYLEGIRACSVHCYNFVPEIGGEERETTAIIYPNSLNFYKNKLGIDWNCSRGLHCYQDSCEFSTYKRE